VGNGGALLNSSDLSAWIGEYSAVTNDLLQAAYGNGTFVGVGQSGAIVTSSDGTNWQQQDSGVTSDITDIIFNGGHFVAATASSSPSLVLISYDGTNWSTLGLATPFTLQSLCALPSGLLFAGANCAILQTGNLTVPQFVPLGLTQNGFALIFSGAIGQSYHLQSSLDLVNWSDVYSFTNSQNPVSLLDPAATGRRAGFYRMMTP